MIMKMEKSIEQLSIEGNILYHHLIIIKVQLIISMHIVYQNT